MRPREFHKVWTDHTIPEQTLPCCGYKIDTVSQVIGDRVGSVDEIPVGNTSISVCMQCGQWLIINPDLSQRLMTAEDIVEMPDDVREHLHDMSRAVHIVRARRK